MSIDTDKRHTGTQAAGRDGSRPAPRGRTDRLPTANRSYGAITAGALLIGVCALLGAVVFGQAGETSSVLAVRDKIAEGQTIARDDLVSKQVSGLDNAMAVEDVETVVGKTAVVDLVAGQVVTASMVTDTPVPGPGLALVGLALKPSQMPGAGLGPGDLVRVIAVAGADAPDPSGDGVDVLSSSARVYSVTGGDAAAVVTVVTIIASDSEAAKLASYGAAGRAAVVKIAAPGGG